MIKVTKKQQELFQQIRQQLDYMEWVLNASEEQYVQQFSWHFNEYCDGVEKAKTEVSEHSHRLAWKDDVLGVFHGDERLPSYIVEELHCTPVQQHRDYELSETTAKLCKRTFELVQSLSKSVNREVDKQCKKAKIERPRAKNEQVTKYKFGIDYHRVSHDYDGKHYHVVLPPNDEYLCYIDVRVPYHCICLRGKQCWTNFDEGQYYEMKIGTGEYTKIHVDELIEFIQNYRYGRDEKVTV